MTDVFIPDEQSEIYRVKDIIYTNIFDTGIMGPVLYGQYRDVVFAGGAFASFFNKEAPKDYDIFILNNNTTIVDNMFNRLIQEGYKVDNHTKRQLEYFKNNRILGVLTAKNMMGKHIATIQIIVTDYKTREELIDHFDYVHCCVSIGFNSNLPYVNGRPPATLYITRNTFDAIKSKTLITRPGKNPYAGRELKFLQRGWKISTKKTLKDFEVVCDKSDDVEDIIKAWNDAYITLAST